jgi:hypothetical protein
MRRRLKAAILSDSAAVLHHKQSVVASGIQALILASAFTEIARRIEHVSSLNIYRMSVPAGS